MAYWIQELGTPNRPNAKVFHADFETDLAKLPTRTTEGEVSEADSTANALASCGDQVLILETSNVYELGYESGWKKL